MGAKKENTYENYVHADASGSSNAMKMYLKEIEEYKMLSAVEEVELAKKVNEEIPEAKEDFINANYRLVVSIAKKYRKENAEIAKILGVTECDIREALDSLREPVSMYEPIYNDGGDTIYLYDQIANKEEEYGLDSRLALERAMNNLKDREINILNERFIIGKTQMEIAEELGISQAQISRIEKNAINNLKKYIK